MKKSLISLEFLKSYLIKIEESLHSIEKRNLENIEEYKNIKRLINEINRIRLKYYRKIQLQNLNRILIETEDEHYRIQKNFNKLYLLMGKLQNTDIFDLFSDSVESHLKKLIKKPEKNINHYYFFSIGNTYYCIYGKKIKIFKAKYLDTMIQFAKRKTLNKKMTLFPEIQTLPIFLEANKEIFFMIIKKPEGYVGFFTQNKVIRKKEIENLKLITEPQSDLIKSYFYYKGKKIYFID